MSEPNGVPANGADETLRIQFDISGEFVTATLYGHDGRQLDTEFVVNETQFKRVGE